MAESGTNDGDDGDHRRVHSSRSRVDGSPYRPGEGNGRLPHAGPVQPAPTTAAGVLAGMRVRTWRLQRELSWVFVLMFVVLLLGAAATVLGVRAS